MGPMGQVAFVGLVGLVDLLGRVGLVGGSCRSNGLIDSAWLGRPGVPTLAVSGHLLAISPDPKVFLNGSRVFDGPKEFYG